MHIAAFLFNTGINTVILLFFSTYNTKRINLSQGTAFNYQGTTFKNFLIVIPMMFFPMALVDILSFFVEMYVIMAILADTGLIGIVLHKQMLTLCINQFNKPFTALDPSTQIRLKRFLNDLQEKTGITMLISSHDLNHITEVCKRIVVLEKGLIVKDIKTGTETLKELESYFAV
jgi:hypothetical protein